MPLLSWTPPGGVSYGRNSVCAERAVSVSEIHSGFLLDTLTKWKDINELVPNEFKSNKKLTITGLAGIFAGSLELVKEGNILLKQEKIFDKIYAKQK